MTRFAVVGHVEWIEFGRFTHVPGAGRDHRRHASGSPRPPAAPRSSPSSSRSCSGDVDFFTALGDDERGRPRAERLAELGVRVHAAPRDAMQRWGFVHLDDDGERTISIVGERHAPHGDGRPAVGAARRRRRRLRLRRRQRRDARGPARASCSSPRRARSSRWPASSIDALVGSGKDRLEQVDPDTLDPPPKLIITTAGKEGGTWQAGEQRKGTFKVAELPGPLVDEYGAGDTFAAGFTYALGAGYEIDDALAFAARAGAANLTGRGPYAAS